MKPLPPAHKGFIAGLAVATAIAVAASQLAPGDSKLPPPPVPGVIGTAARSCQVGVPCLEQR